MTPEQAAGLEIIRQGGLVLAVVGLVIGFWLFLTERLVPAGRLKEANERTTKAESQRDEAMALAKSQTEATKEVGSAARETLQYLRDNLPRRRG